MAGRWMCMSGISPYFRSSDKGKAKGVFAASPAAIAFHRAKKAALAKIGWLSAS
jgi:hypothetical protein